MAITVREKQAKVKRFWTRVGTAGWLVLLASASAAGGGEERLAEAVRQNDAAAVRTLLRAGADANARDVDTMTALHWAARLDDAVTAEVLVQGGADVGAVTRYGVTPLTLAAINGSAGMIELLLKAGADPDAGLPKGETPLMTAARTGALPAVEVLLAHGARVNVREARLGQTALMWAAAENHVAVVRALIDAGAAVETRSTGGLTPLLFAVRDGHIETVRLLLARGAHPDETMVPEGGVSTALPTSRTPTGADGSSALALAIINKRHDVALLLIEQGADPNVPDPRGSLLHTIAWVRRPGADIGVQYVPPPTDDRESLAVAAALLTHGANPDARIAWDEIPYDTDGNVRQPSNILIGRNFLSFVGATPFYLAAKHSDVALMRLLAAHGADPVLPTAQGITPLMAAAGIGFWDGESPGPTTGVPETDTLAAVELCVQLGNDIHAVTDFGDAELVGDGVSLLESIPLHIAKNPAEEIGDLRWNGSTALHGAAFRGLETVVRFLVGEGARVNATNTLGWTPMTVAGGFFVANNYHEPNPRMVALLRELMAQPLP